MLYTCSIDMITASQNTIQHLPSHVLQQFVPYNISEWRHGFDGSCVIVFQIKLWRHPHPTPFIFFKKNPKEMSELCIAQVKWPDV